MPIERLLDDPTTAATLMADGGVLYRNALIMMLDLTGLGPRRPASSDHSIEPMDRARVAEYAAISTLAYGPGHADHQPDDMSEAATAATFVEAFDGLSVGPWMPAASRHSVNADGRIIGALIICAAPDTPGFDAGPFVDDVFIDPTFRGHGIGAALLDDAAHWLADAGHHTLTLVVTVGNPAQQVYERLGFVVRHESWRIDMPD